LQPIEIIRNRACEKVGFTLIRQYLGPQLIVSFAQGQQQKWRRRQSVNLVAGQRRHAPTLWRRELEQASPGAATRLQQRQVRTVQCTDIPVINRCRALERHFVPPQKLRLAMISCCYIQLRYFLLISHVRII
jgi:hypothetical protein